MELSKLKAGRRISFFLEVWTPHFQKKIVTTEILRIDINPMNNEDIKCSVMVNNENYGIPIEEIISVDFAIGEQLKLNL